MGYYRERPVARKLPQKAELMAAISDGSFFANLETTTHAARKEAANKYMAAWAAYFAQQAEDKLLFVGPPTLAEIDAQNRLAVDKFDNWEDRYDSLGHFRPDWHD